jgi:hypothetical protein
MADLIPPASVRLRRDVGQVIRAIKSHALMHRADRDRDEDGQIVANAVDYILVRELMNDILAEGSGLAVNPAIVQTTTAVIDATAAMSVGKILKLDKSAARRRLVKATTEGFVVNLETRKGQPGRYRATGQQVEAAMLTTTDAPMSAGLAIDKPFNSNENAPPVARWHESSEEAEEDLGLPEFLARRPQKLCAQCNAGDGELEPHKVGSELVWLHPECVRFWKATKE